MVPRRTLTTTTTMKPPNAFSTFAMPLKPWRPSSLPCRYPHFKIRVFFFIWGFLVIGNCGVSWSVFFLDWVLMLTCRLLDSKCEYFCYYDACFGSFLSLNTNTLHVVMKLATLAGICSCSRRLWLAATIVFAAKNILKVVWSEKMFFFILFISCFHF